MTVGGFDGSRATRRWTAWLAAAAGAWSVFAWLIAPPVIRSAHSGGAFGFLGGLMSGRTQHPVERYLGYWDELAFQGLVALGVLWVTGALVLRPATWRLLRSGWERIPTFGGRLKRPTVAVAVVLLAITVAMHAGSSGEPWKDASGYEYERIGRSISEGMGFSFPPGVRWLYLAEEPAAHEYGATAWKEPVYPYFMAGWFEALGEGNGRIAVAACQLAFLLATAFLVYLLGRRLFGPLVGGLGAVGTISLPELHELVTNLQVQAVSALFLVAVLLLLFRFSDDPGLRGAVGIGVLLGLAALTHVVLILLVPIAALFVFLHGGEAGWRGRARPALLVGLVAALVISPWTIRNYVQFGHLIPVQTGFGMFANVTTPYLAETYQPDLDPCGDGSDPIFRAADPYEAVMTLREGENYSQTWRRGVHCVARSHAGGYTTLNEHERDGLHRAQLGRFLRERPLTFLELAGTKALVYLFDVRDDGRGATMLAVLGLAGALLVARRRRMWVFTAVILAYSVPFVLTAPLYYRYRAPLAPLLALLAVVLIARVLERPVRRLLAAWGAGPR